MYAFVMFILFNIALAFVKGNVINNTAECSAVVSQKEMGLKYAKNMVACLRQKNGFFENLLMASVYRAIDAMPNVPKEFVGTWDASQPRCNYRHTLEENGAFTSEPRDCSLSLDTFHGTWGVYDNQMIWLANEGMVWPPDINPIDTVDKDFFLLVEQDGSRTKFSRVIETPSSLAITSAPAATVESAQSDITDMALHESNSEAFMAGETVYVTTPSASVNMNGTIISLSINVEAKVKKFSDCSYENDSNDGKICIFIGEIFGDEIDPGFPAGLAPANRFSHNQLNLDDLLAEYDQTPKENNEIRRELAEKAVALDPWSNEAHKRLIEVLTEANDSKASDAAIDTFQHYQAHQPQIPKGELPTIFYYDGDRIRPFAANVMGVIKAANPKAASQRGTFFNIYSDSKEGLAVTMQSFSCEPRCPGRIPVRNLDIDGKPTNSKLKGVYATNFIWTETNKSLPAVTSVQKLMLTNILNEKIVSYSGEAASMAKEKIKSGGIEMMSGQLSEDGRIFLVASLHIGSASDSHYSDIPFVSEFVILEQQKDGDFIKASTNVSDFITKYCNISSVLRDMTGDGTDEIITYCNDSVEGPDDDNLNGILQRIKNQWVRAF